MINYFNSRPWSPEGRNLLNSEGWEGYNGELDYRPERDDPLHPWALLSAANRYGDTRPTSVGFAAHDNTMPVFKPGEVSSDPEPIQPRADPYPGHPPASPSFMDKARSMWRDVTGEGQSEGSIPELPPWVKVNGHDNSGYAKIALARGDMAAAKEIALRQFPGSSIRDDAYGNPVIRLPDGATRTDWRVAGYDFDGNPAFETSEVPIAGEYYLNKRGISQRDLADFAVAQGVEGVAGLAGGALGGAVGMPIAGGAAGAGLGAEAMYAAAQQAGSTQDIDWWDVAKTAAGEASYEWAKKFAKRWLAGDR